MPDSTEIHALHQQFLSFRDTWWPDVEAEMARLVNDMTQTSSPLRRMYTYHMGTGGKRLRAILPLMIAESLGMDPARAVPFAAACEMLHNASLVHDDLQDGDSMRRGNPTVWKKFGAAQAINMGDAMIAFTLLLSERLDAEPGIREAVKSRTLSEMLRVIDGQAIEFDMKARGDTTVAAYMRMVEGKTSSLFSLPVGGAALLAGAPEPVERGLMQAAAQIGVLFQIQDDLLDLYGDKGRLSPGGDIREGKPTVLAVHFLERASAADASWLGGILDKAPNATTPEDVDRVREAFRTSGSLGFALQELDRRRDMALRVSEADPAFERPMAVMEQACNLFLAPIAGLRAQGLSAA